MAALRRSLILVLCGGLLAASAAPSLADTASSNGPVVSWTSPSNNATYPAYSTVPLSVSADDSGATVTSVTFFLTTGRVLGTVQPSGSGANLNWSSVAPGSYSVRARAVDNLQRSGLSPALTVNVSPATGGNGSGAFSLTVIGGPGASGTGQYTAGTVVSISAGSPPSGQTFQHWTGALVTDPSAPTTTLTMPASSVTVTATFYAPPPVPQPVTTHPRLWVTAGDIPRLQGWAVTTNTAYQQGMLPLLQRAVSVYQNQFAPFFGGGPAPTTAYPDPGDAQGYTGSLTEEFGAVLAFNSLIDPSPTARATYAQWARNLIMYALNQAALGHQTGAPFRDPAFAIYNRANGSGEEWPLIVDWIYPVLSAQDKATIRNVFLQWANDCLTASTTGGDHPSPVGAENTTSLLPFGKAYRMAANNYYLGHARLLTMMSLSLDPGDDPAVNPAQPSAVLGNTLRSFIPNATGAWLYQEFAQFGDGPTVASQYGLGNGGAGLGLSSGGLPSEGMLYGHSLGFVLGQLLALQTAGFGDPTLSGPQANLIGSPEWGRMVDGFLSSLVPKAQVVPGYAYLGPVYQMTSYGDLLRLWMTPDFMAPFALLTQLERRSGQVDQSGAAVHDNQARWFVTNALEGGSAGLSKRMTNPWSFAETVLYYLMLDPAAPAPADPRPSLPTSFVDPGAGRLIARTDWGPNATMFDYRASWESINHQDADGGQFELYRKGEWLTKEMSNYDSAGVGQASPYHNTMSIQNATTTGSAPTNLQWFQTPLWNLGSQWYLGANAGDPSTSISSGPSYAAASSDLTNLYNRPDPWNPANAAMAVSGASRSIVWLNADYVVVYDRATTTQTGLFKRENFNVIGQPTVVGNTATSVTPNGQQLYVQSLLPSGAAFSSSHAVANLSTVAQMEPTQWQLTIDDAQRPADSRFLTVLQGADPGAPKVPAALVASSAGEGFDGAAFGLSAVYFPHDLKTSFTSTTLPIPVGATTMIVTGLPAGAGVSTTIQGGQVTVTAGGSSAIADASGILRLTF
ncbi:MAG: hypothetical protein NVS3B21_26410 [Acidimicrobiales bacterium]